jgi:DNA recombination protein RmuC
MQPLQLAILGAVLLMILVALLLLGSGRRRGRDMQARLAVAEHQAGELAGARMVEAQLRARVEQLTADKSERERLHAHEAALVAERTLALTRATEALHHTQTECEAQRSELATLRETLLQERRKAVESQKLLQDARDSMTREFKLLAEEIMQRHGKTFAAKNLEQIDGTLKPLQEKILEFQQNLQAAHKDSGIERALLVEQIRQLGETSAKMSTETRTLAQALRGKSQTQGAWGEMILQTILEKSGLREGDEYVVQQSHTNDDGDRLRPDVIVRLPNDQSIVVDAKVSLTGYAASVAAETEEERAAHLRTHVSSMRQHVRTLAGKDYQKHAGSVDYVVMFVPIEGALAAALTVDPDLTSTAIEGSVYIATPTTLMIALRTAANVWHVERRNRNAEEIAARAGKIYDKLFGFVESMDGLGKALGTAYRQYDKAMNQLARGNGNVLRQAEQLKMLGAKTSRAMPGHLLDDSADLAVEEAGE